MPKLVVQNLNDPGIAIILRHDVLFDTASYATVELVAGVCTECGEVVIEHHAGVAHSRARLHVDSHQA